MKTLTEAAKTALEDYAWNHCDELVGEDGEDGLFVPFDAVPDFDNTSSSPFKQYYPSDWYYLLDGHIPDKRLEEIEVGAALTVEEQEIRRDQWLEKQFCGEHDADRIPAYAICEVKKRGYKGYALIFTSGYSFEGVRRWVEEVFATSEEAWEYLEQRGWPG
jgi:hypothetical protein